MCVWQSDKYQGGCAPYPNWRQRLNTARCPALDAMALLIDLPRPRAPAIRLEARLICQQGQQDSHFACPNVTRLGQGLKRGERGSVGSPLLSG